MGVRIPRRLKQRPQWKGLPIPYIATIKPDGEADFRVTDMEKRYSVMSYHLCQLCGEPLGKYCFFVGGPRSAEQKAYFEPAAHLDCLIYAMKVCPFIVGKMQHADIAKVQADNPGLHVHVDDTYENTKSDEWVIMKATGWGYVKTQGGTVMIVPWETKRTGLLRPQQMTAQDWTVVYEELMKND